ncbi:hypothetical protein QUB80_07520 [Chlorogloeopsis sp. ULAP01]|uniref:hypothetical protein n=1 Tax=Chlorogloeopsis sp. ULAP01 TaxID=3056483 RepID=UPI0025AAC456|nr:hypothetical protein [Chlorogloeopsis sp. ULAP01]MDM9380553.1 hypothetical protein [Chlorogloeopsis sp. ULAP01]
MQSKGWKNLWSLILLISGSTNWCFTNINRTWAVNSNYESIQDKFGVTNPSVNVEVTHQPCQQQELKAVHVKFQRSCSLQATNQNRSTDDEAASKNDVQNLRSQIPPALIQPKSLTSQSTPLPKANVGNNQPTNEPPQLETQPTEIPLPSPTQIDEKLKTPETVDKEQRLQRLLQRLQENKQPPSESIFEEELGKLRLREVPLPLEQPQPLPIEQIAVPFKPIGYLQAYVSYFQTNNIFSSAVDPTEDALIFSGLTLASMPIPLGSNTFLNGSIDGGIYRYFNQGKYNYNQVRFNLSIYQQLTRRMYGEFGWTNQQLFYARDGDFFKAGDRFLNENSLRLSLGRRDPLTSRLMLDSFYEFRVSFTDPQEQRNRVSNFLWVSLNYYLQRAVQVGLNYQFGLSNFSQRDREDQYHRLYSHLNYRISDYTNINLQTGVTLGGSTDPFIDFDSWFLSVNYNLQLGRF